MGKMRIFVSHHHGDNTFTDRLVTALEGNGADVWWDRQNLGLQALHDTIDSEIAARSVFVGIVSEGALASAWVKDEFSWAYNRFSIDQSSGKSERMMLFVLAEDVDLQHMSGRMLGFLRVESGGGKAYPQDRAIGETIATLHRAIDSTYYPTHVAHSMRHRYEELGGESNPLLGPPLLIDRNAAKSDTSPQGSRGYRHWHAAGNGSASIYWSERGGAHPVWGAIRQLYKGRGSRHGFPLTGELDAAESQHGTVGKYQRFEGDSNYPEDITDGNVNGDHRFGATIYWCPKHGAKTTWGGIGEYYEHLGGTKSALGFPRHSEHEAAMSHRGTKGWYQDFEGGTVHWSEPTGAALVSGPIGSYYSALGGSGSWLGFPASEELPAAVSLYHTAGTFQRFEGDWEYPEDVLHLLARVRCGATVYYCESYGAQPTGWGIGVIYERMHGTGGVLGFPTSPELPVESARHGTLGKVQRFEGGAIYYRKQENLVVAVVGAMNDAYEAAGGVSGDFGFPVAPAEPAQDTHPRQSLQRFEGGIIGSVESEKE